MIIKLIFLKVFFSLIFIRKITAETTITTPTTTLENDVNIYTTMGTQMITEGGSVAEKTPPTVNEIIKAMENLSNFLKDDSSLLDDVGETLNAISPIVYLLKNNSIFSDPHVLENDKNFKTAKQNFLKTFSINFLTMDSTREKLYNLFKRHNFSAYHIPFLITTKRDSEMEKLHHFNFDDFTGIFSHFYNNIDHNKKEIKYLQNHCTQIDVYYMLIDFVSGDGNLYDVLKNEAYSDQTLSLIDEFVMSMTKQLLITGTICNEILNLLNSNRIYSMRVKKIMEWRDLQIKKRNENFWSLNVTNPIIQGYLNSLNNSGNDEIAKNLSESMKQNYTKTGYVFGIGVYKAINENFDHAFYGNNVFVVSNYTKKNVFIMRTEASQIYKSCIILNSIEDYEAEICQETTRGRNLPSLIRWLQKKCPDLGAISIVRSNLDFHGFSPKNGMMSKNIQFKKCYFGFTLSVAFKAAK